MKYPISGKKIPLPERKEQNRACLLALEQGSPAMSPEEIYHNFTGIGGLHGLNYVDYGNYHDFSEAKKEIEQGQFFTSDALCKWVMDCIQPEEWHRIADLTCGKGSFFNQIYEEKRLYGCEIDPDSFAIARHLFPEANLTLGDIRTYAPGVHFHLVVGNPPYNLKWNYQGRTMSSQTVYILKAAELLFPGGLLAVIVPETFLGEGTKKIEVKRIYDRFSHVVQVRLDPDAFAWLGVRNFPTKLLILQRKGPSIPETPYRPELIETANAGEVYWKYVHKAKESCRDAAPEIQLALNRQKREAEEKRRREQQLLYQIKIHPKTRDRYEECRTLLERYYSQKRPLDMKYEEWEAARLHYQPVMASIRQVLQMQNHVEEDRVELVKGKRRFYYKAYSQKVQPEADSRNADLEIQEISQIITSGSTVNLDAYGPYQGLLRRKQREYRRQTEPYAQMAEDPAIREWLQNWELTDQWGRGLIKLNERQLHDTNLILQKRYAYLQWSQGAGKTVSGTVQGMYRLAHGQADYVFVLSSAISIETTWVPFLKKYLIPHKVIHSSKDLRRVYPGDFVLITLGRARNYQRQIQKIVKLAGRRLFLIYDEAQNSSALEANEEVGRLTKATIACFHSLRYKLLMSGTSINNNVVESYPQLYLLYNASVNMLSKAQTLYSFSEEEQDYIPHENPYYMKPYPPYIEGLSCFRHSHLPEKLTVFGVVQRRQDILNAEVLRELIGYTMLTRTFREVTGKNLEHRRELRAVMKPEESALYLVALKEFTRLEKEYFKSTTMSARKKAQARIIAQIKIMLRICTCATVFRDYHGPLVTGKLEAIFGEIRKIPRKRVAIGVRQNNIVRAYTQAVRQAFPNRPVFTITGSEMQPHQRRNLVYGQFKDYDNSILVCTQQSLSESISIDSVDYCFIAELHWNDSKMSQFYYRFIRYTSTRDKYIYYMNYPESIETNLIYLLVAKERMLRFLKGQEISFEELFEEMGFDLSHHRGAVFRGYDTKGRPELYWGQQQIAA